MLLEMRPGVDLGLPAVFTTRKILADSALTACRTASNLDETFVPSGAPLVSASEPSQHLYLSSALED